MTFSAAIGWSLMRSAIIAIVGTWVALRMNEWLRSLNSLASARDSRPAAARDGADATGPALAGIRRRGGMPRRLAWLILLLPFFTPSLVIGYCYRDTAMSLVHTPLLRELLYGVLVAAQSIPVAVLLLRFAPPPGVSDTALHGARLFRVRRGGGWRRLPFPVSFWLHSRSRSCIAAAAVLTLLSFQEAELATLMQASTWTEWMFTRHAGGLALSETLRLSAVPVLIQLPFLFPVVLWIVRQRGGSNGQLERVSTPRPWSRGLCGCWLLAAAVLVCLAPLWQMWRGARRGMPVLWEQPSLPREIGDALLLSLTAGLGAVALGSWMRSLSVQRGAENDAPLPLSHAPGLSLLNRIRKGTSLPLVMLILIPGCLGNLPLGLSLAAVFQTAWLRAAYDTPVPLILGEILFLLPRTMILLTCIAALRTATGEHALGLLSSSLDPRQRAGAREIAWKLKGRAWFAVIVIVCFWAYLEVMLPSTLAMPGMTPVGLVLYNALHYGRITALGAKLALALVLPLLLACAFLILRRVIFRPG